MSTTGCASVSEQSAMELVLSGISVTAESLKLTARELEKRLLPVLRPASQDQGAPKQPTVETVRVVERIKTTAGNFDETHKILREILDRLDV